MYRGAYQCCWILLLYVNGYRLLNVNKISHFFDRVIIIFDIQMRLSLTIYLYNLMSNIQIILYSHIYMIGNRYIVLSKIQTSIVCSIRSDGQIVTSGIAEGHLVGIAE